MTYDKASTATNVLMLDFTFSYSRFSAAYTPSGSIFFSFTTVALHNISCSVVIIWKVPIDSANRVKWEESQCPVLRLTHLYCRASWQYLSFTVAQSTSDAQFTAIQPWKYNWNVRLENFVAKKQACSGIWIIRTPRAPIDGASVIMVVSGCYTPHIN